MRRRQTSILTGFIISGLLVLTALVSQTFAQEYRQNPTPIVITLTPGGNATAVPNPTGDGSLQPDRFEPNNSAGAATEVGLQIESDLTLIGDDVDYFTGYFKAGQMVRVSTAVYQGLDTRLKVYRDGQLIAENDDRSVADMGSTVIVTAVSDGWYMILVEKATVYDGVYALQTVLVEPTATPTAAPTLTPSPTQTPLPTPTPIMQPDLAEPNNTLETAWPVTPGQQGTYTVGAGDVDTFTFIAKAGNHYACETVTEQVDTQITVTGAADIIGVNDDRVSGRVDSYLAWTTPDEQQILIKVEARGGSFGQYEFICQHVVPPPAPSMPPAPVVKTPSPTMPVTNTAAVTATEHISLTVQHIGRAQPQITIPTTSIRLLVYYDANNDRQPGPGEGIANVSVLAVDTQGQRIARAFTNAQGEAIFNLTSTGIARVIVPFVPGWSERVRAGEASNDIVLGLPAVRLPIFLPVQNQLNDEA